MRFYFNELSLDEMSQDEAGIEETVDQFIQQCVDLEKIGFNELRSHIYILDIAFPNGLLLATWAKNRHHGNRELKTRFKNLALNAPFFHDDEESLKGKLAWAKFSFLERESLGMGASFLANSLVVSFKTNALWDKSILEPLIYEYIDDTTESIKVSEEVVLNVSDKTHILLHETFGLDKIKTLAIPNNWLPQNDHLPNLTISNSLLKIRQFYDTFKNLGPKEKRAQARVMGRKVAEMNFYKFDPAISKLNKDNDHIRDIFVSLNTTGHLNYLSIDVEKGAFEVCDHDGIQQKELLFDGTRSQKKQKTDHSIKLK